MTSREQFIFQMGRMTGASRGDVERIMRYGATHVRIETELTNGYKRHHASCWRPKSDFRCCDGEHDTVATAYNERKRDRIDAKLEKLCAQINLRVEYGALTVRLLDTNGREIAIP